MTTAYPGAIDALPRPTASTARNAPGFEHSAQHDNVADAIEAIEAKLGTAAAIPTNLGDVAYVTGAGASTWGPRAAVRLAEQQLGSPAASVTFSGIPQTYRHLLLIASTRQNDAAPGMSGLGLRFNGDASAVYCYQIVLAAGSSISTFGSVGQGEMYLGGSGGGGSAGANFVINDIVIANYSYNGIHKQCRGLVSGAEGASIASSMKMFISGGTWTSGAPITSLTCLPQAGSFITASRFTLYGIPA
jgi:hypothetical protein